MVLHDHSATTIWRRRRVEIETGNSCSTIYLRISEGLMTIPIHVGPRARGWPAREITALNAARIAGQSDEQIRTLVTRLHAERGASNDETRDGRTLVTVLERSG